MAGVTVENTSNKGSVLFFKSTRPLFHRSLRKMTYGLEEEDDRTLQRTQEGGNRIVGGPLRRPFNGIRSLINTKQRGRGNGRSPWGS